MPGGGGRRGDQRRDTAEGNAVGKGDRGSQRGQVPVQLAGGLQLGGPSGPVAEAGRGYGASNAVPAAGAGAGECAVGAAGAVHVQHELRLVDLRSARFVGVLDVERFTDRRQQETTGAVLVPEWQRQPPLEQHRRGAGVGEQGPLGRHGVSGPSKPQHDRLDRRAGRQLVVCHRALAPGHGALLGARRDLVQCRRGWGVLADRRGDNGGSPDRGGCIAGPHLQLGLQAAAAVDARPLRDQGA
mmetsp:Transcript_118482/g.342596  ORF Transcript_118482/g.342596 Transcript_118482/m.342596 type:complete len:242 (+) Transcript_118482:921-1646(+)